MNGFKVNTDALAQSGVGYRKASNGLSDCARRLRKEMVRLNTQRLSGVDQAIKLLQIAIDAASSSVLQAEDLGRQCEQISKIYEAAERQAFADVEALPHGGNKFASVMTTATTAVGVAVQTAQLAQSVSYVDSVFTPAAPTMIVNNNHMPSESWLVDRAIKAVLENEK